MNSIIRISGFAWDKGNLSINDYIRNYLKDQGVRYYNTLGGTIFARFGGKYVKTYAERTKDGTYDILVDSENVMH